MTIGLAVMNTPLALTVMNPSGKGSMRILKESTLYQEARSLINKSLTAQEVWQSLVNLASDPLRSLKCWALNFGIAMSQDLNDAEKFHFGAWHLPLDPWLPYIQRIRLCAADPQELIRFFEVASSQFGIEAIADLKKPPCICVRGNDVGVLTHCFLPSESRPGDEVNECSQGSTPYFVFITEGALAENGELVLKKGLVLSKITQDQAPFVQDVLNQPMVTGCNRTYRCEESSPEGWLEMCSTDSLAQAEKNVEESKRAGYDARIINLLTQEEVHSPAFQ